MEVYAKRQLPSAPPIAPPVSLENAENGVWPDDRVRWGSEVGLAGQGRQEKRESKVSQGYQEKWVVQGRKVHPV